MGITLDLLNDRVVLSGWDNPSTPSKCRAVGGRFDVKTKTWRFKLNMATCRALRQQFPDLSIAPKLDRWARQAVQQEKALAAMSAGEVALRRVPELTPTLDAAMSTRPYQRNATAWGAATGSFLLADEQGLGKTIETLATIIEYSDRPQWHLILAPLVAVESVWTREAVRWVGRDLRVAVVALTGSLKQRQDALADLDIPYETRHVFVVANIESARIKPVENPRTGKSDLFKVENAALPQLFARHWDTIVVDECQRALIRTSGKKTQTRAGFEILSKNSRRRIALSGTPMRGKPEQLWGTLNWLRPDVYSGYWSWVGRYFSTTSNGFSNYILNGFLPGGEDRLAEDLKPIMLRRTKAEVLTELPPKQYGGSLIDPEDPNSPIGVWLDPNATQLKQIRQFERDGLLDFGNGQEVLAEGVLAMYTRSRQLANGAVEFEPSKRTIRPTLDSPKYEWLLDFVQELGGAKVVVASQFTSLIEVYAKALRNEGITVSVLTGKTSAQERASLVEDFQTTPNVQVFMLNTKAGGVALTLDAADNLVILDETSIPDDQAQVEDRIHRASRNHNVTVYYLRCLGTMDEEIAYVAAARADIQAYLMDGVRGVDTARKLYEDNQRQLALDDAKEG